MINPVGLSYLLLDKNNRYNHKKALATINTTTSETKRKDFDDFNYSKTGLRDRMEEKYYSEYNINKYK
jgi:hypothetical protein